MVTLNFLETKVRTVLHHLKRRRGWRFLSLPMIFLLIEFFDELHYSASGAVLPALRDELGLTYAHVGLLLGLPNVINIFIEPGLMLLGDTRMRKILVIGGGLAILAALLMVGMAQGFIAVLVAMILAYPASGAFVTLSQATLMDLNHGREAQMMARWAVAGSLASLAGPLIVAGGFALGWSWRWVFFALAGVLLVLVGLVAARSFPAHLAHPEGETIRLPELWANLVEALHTHLLMRWVLLMQVADLMLDIFSGYVVLYYTDVLGATPAQASLVLGLVMAANLASDVVLIPLLERVPGRSLVRLSAWMALVLYPAWLLAPWPGVKIVLLLAVNFTTMGWYQVLSGEAYAAARGRSGTVSAISSVAGLLGGVLAWSVGFTAGELGLQAAMWLLLLGPVCLALFVPKAVPTG